MYYFFGKLIAKAFFDRVPLNLCFNRSIFNALLNRIDIEYEKNLKEEFMMIDKELCQSFGFFIESDLVQMEDIIF